MTRSAVRSTVAATVAGLALLAGGAARRVTRPTRSPAPPRWPPRPPPRRAAGFASLKSDAADLASTKVDTSGTAEQVQQQVDALAAKADKVRDDLATMMRESEGGPAAAVIGVLNQKADARNEQAHPRQGRRPGRPRPQITAAQDDITAALEPVTAGSGQGSARREGDPRPEPARHPTHAASHRPLPHRPTRGAAAPPPPEEHHVRGHPGDRRGRRRERRRVHAVHRRLQRHRCGSRRTRRCARSRTAGTSRSTASSSSTVTPTEGRDQKATDHSTKKGLKWGLVGGAALGLVFPPSIIASAAALGTGGHCPGQGQAGAQQIGLEKDLADAVAQQSSFFLEILK